MFEWLKASARVAGLVFVTAVMVAVAGCGGDDRSGVEGTGANGKRGTTPGGLTTVHVFVGGEKMELLGNERFRQLLADKHGIVVEAVKAGSVEMVRTLPIDGKDALWPSNDIAVDFFKMRGGVVKKDEIIFNSPIVIYTGWKITEALINEGLVEKRDEGYYIVKFPELLQMIGDEKEWRDIGLPFYGSVVVRCTDPTKSNSGNMFAGLVANMLNGGRVVNDTTIKPLLPQLVKFFERLGMMEHSSGDIFRKFIATGINNSMVVGYENQLVEFVLATPKDRDAILNAVCILYPLPTVWSSHPVIALTDKGKRLIDALKDDDIQELAWRMHGFRSGLMGVTQDPAVLGMPHMPSSIDSVIPLPTAEAMDQIVEALSR
jgi:hypothetical protein